MTDDVLSAAQQKVKWLREKLQGHERAMDDARNRAAKAHADADQAQAELDALLAANEAARQAFSAHPYWGRNPRPASGKSP